MGKRIVSEQRSGGQIMDSPLSILPLQVELSCIFDANRLSDLLLGTGDSMARFKCLKILSVSLMPCLTLPYCSFIILVSAKDIKNSLFNMMLRHTHIYMYKWTHMVYSFIWLFLLFSRKSYLVGIFLYFPLFIFMDVHTWDVPICEYC